MPWKSSAYGLAALLLGFGASQGIAQIPQPTKFPVFPGGKAPDPNPISSAPEGAIPQTNGSNGLILPASANSQTDTGALPTPNLFPEPGPESVPSYSVPSYQGGPRVLKDQMGAAFILVTDNNGNNERIGVDFIADDSEFDISTTSDRPYLNLDGEYLLFTPRGNPSAVAETRPGPGAGQYSNTVFIPGGFESGFRFGGALVDPVRKVDLALRYTYYSWQSDIWSYSKVSNPPFYYPYYPNPAAMSGTSNSSLVALPSGGMNPLLMAPSYIGPVAQVSAQSNILFQFGDLEFAKTFRPEERIDVRLFAGPRYAYLSQSLQAQYTGGSVTSANYGSKVMFNGAGMRVGGDALVKLFENLGLRLWGSASVLAGAYEGRVDQSINGNNVASMRETVTGAVPILDGGIGLIFGDQRYGLTIGYEFQSWINVLQGYTGTYDTYQTRMQRQYGNLGFDGFSGLGVQGRVSW